MESKSYIEEFKESFPDAKELTKNQWKNLLRLMSNAFIELRHLTFHEMNQQAYDLADAFHNLPGWLTLEVFSFGHFRMYLDSYHQKHPKGVWNYLELLNKIERNENLDGYND